MSCGLVFLHARPPLCCSPTHRLLKIKPDLQASLSVLVSSPLSRDCQPCDEHWHRQGYQAHLLVQPYCRGVHTQLGSTVPTDGTAVLAWRWTGCWAVARDPQGLFFPICCKWLHLFSCKQLFFFWLFLSPLDPSSTDTHTQSITSLCDHSSLPPGISYPGFVQVVSPGECLEQKSSPLWLLLCALKAP